MSELLDIAIATFEAMEPTRFWADDIDAPEGERIYPEQIVACLKRLRGERIELPHESEREPAER